jgi:cellulose synthase/poly-beta-1,6-N-acetylglucosamine synthase-like glycosyltransferase
VTSTAGWVLVAASAAVGVAAYAGYPAWLWLTTRSRSRPRSLTLPSWPSISITVPAYNEAHSIADTLERLLALDYPADRRQIVVVSDASSDGTDDIVRGFARRGVELVRLPQRAGKTAAENAAREHLRGDLVVQTDASVRIDQNALKPLVAAFLDERVGVASGRDVSVARDDGGATAGESGYVGYEMWVRDLETAAGGIVGASGCLYATRRALHMESVPEALSRDFAAPLIAREHGYQSVSVPEAVCFVPRTASLRREYRRKVRTMTRGLGTLLYKRHLLNPLRFGGFAVRLWAHKLVRWLVPWAAVTGVIGLGLAADAGSASARAMLILGGVVVIMSIAAWFRPDDRPLPRWLGLPAFAFWGVVAGLHAWINALRGELHPVWEPTRRR